MLVWYRDEAPTVRGPSHALKSCCVWQYLEWREKQYDLRVRVDVFGHESAEEPIVRGALTYIASDNRLKNLNYAGARCQTCSGQGCTHSRPSDIVPLLLSAKRTASPLQSAGHIRTAEEAVFETDGLAPRSLSLSCAGPAPREAIALQIASAFGPSGPNAEYLHSLVAALKQVWAATSALQRRAALYSWHATLERDVKLSQGYQEGGTHSQEC